MIDTTKGERIAYRSTQGDGIFAKDRWTELAVYFQRQPQLGGHRWCAEVKGCSAVPGDRTQTRSRSSHTLEGALEIISSGKPGAALKAQARDWRDANVPDDGKPIYTEAQRDAAIEAARYYVAVSSDAPACMAAIAEALGMRRAQA